MRTETELFFNTLVREDRSVLDLFRADYTFVNERLARHYGIPGVAGNHFRRVTYPDDTRRGLLGQGSVLVQTSLANRTSPVLRGKWVMEVLLGTPPPPPPPDVPILEDTAESKDGRMLTTRERMELHRSNPTCNSCHRFMDPIGLALDNFDVTGKWRERENGMPLDTQGDFYDGTPVSTPAELDAALHEAAGAAGAHVHREPDGLRAGPPRRVLRQPAVRAIAKAAEADGYRMSSFILGVVKSDAFRMKRADAGDDGPTADKAAVDDSRRAVDRSGESDAMFNGPYTEETETMHFITGKHMPRRTFLRGMGATVALPFLDAMVAGRSAAQGRGGRPLTPGWCASRKSTACPAATPGARSKYLFAPAHTGRDFSWSPTTRSSTLEAYRDYMTIVSNTDVRMAEAFTPPEIGGDHFRSSAVFLTQSHPKQTQGSDIFGRHLAGPAATRSGSARARRCRRCSSASRTSTRPAAAPTTTRAPTPTRSAGRRRTSRCR